LQVWQAPSWPWAPTRRIGRAGVPGLDTGACN